MHFSNYFRFMETAEHAFLRSLGFSVILPSFKPPLALPRVHASCDYKAPLQFEDVVEVHLLVRQIKSKSINYQFRFAKLNAEPPMEVARGALTVVCVACHPNGKMSAVPLPQCITEKIEVAPQELLA
jgi:YbgC/YbaW family acyl-CoA thioester hydrolase